MNPKNYVEIIENFINEGEPMKGKALQGEVTKDIFCIFVREGITLADRFIKANVFADRMRELFNHLQAFK